MLTRALTPLAAHKFPDTRYMGSKQGLLDFIWGALKSLNFDTVLDAFSGSGCVGYMFKICGKTVAANDHLEYAYHVANGTIANNSERLDDDDVALLLKSNPRRKGFIQKTFRGLYFTDEENKFLDNACANILLLTSAYKRSIAIASLGRACVKRRPRGVFTYVGLGKYDDGRLDLRLGLREHFIRAVNEYNLSVFDNGKGNSAHNEDVFDLEIGRPDLVYIDPPYVTLHSDNDYLRRYHFIEGLASYWRGGRVEVLYNTKTRKLRMYPTPFARKATIYDAFDRLFGKFARSKLAVSYSSNCLPTKEEMLALLRNHGKAVTVEHARHRYSFGTHNHKVGNPTNVVDEYLFIAI